MPFVVMARSSKEADRSSSWVERAEAGRVGEGKRARAAPSPRSKSPRRPLTNRARLVGELRRCRAQPACLQEEGPLGEGEGLGGLPKLCQASRDVGDNGEGGSRALDVGRDQSSPLKVPSGLAVNAENVKRQAHAQGSLGHFGMVHAHHRLRVGQSHVGAREDPRNPDGAILRGECVLRRRRAPGSQGQREGCDSADDEDGVRAFFGLGEAALAQHQRFARAAAEGELVGGESEGRISLTGDKLRCGRGRLGGGRRSRCCARCRSRYLDVDVHGR